MIAISLAETLLETSMLTLCGFSASNYYNKVKFALLEKGVPFTEELAWVGQTDPAASPLGKVPYLKTAQGTLCESGVIMEYIEDQYPQHPLLPADPFAAAKVRELVTFLELHLELVARNLYPEAFFGGKVSDSSKERVRKTLERNLPAFKRLARFAPYAAGETFTLADGSTQGAIRLAAVGEDLRAAVVCARGGAAIGAVLEAARLQRHRQQDAWHRRSGELPDHQRGQHLDRAAGGVHRTAA